MTARIFVSNPTGDYFEIDYTDFRFAAARDFDRGDSFEFTAPEREPVLSGGFVQVERYGGTIYRGAIRYAAGGWGEPIKWSCESIPELLGQRHTFPMTYGAPPVVGDYAALTVSQVLSSDPPSQSAGVDQYVSGLIWMAQSYLSVDPDEITEEGVRIWKTWGSNSRGGTRDIYCGGRKCTEVDLEDIDAGDYRFYRDEDDLYIFGVGVGDYGPYCIDGAFDYGLRLGDLDRGSDFMLAALDIGIEDYWQLIHDYLLDLGLYLRLRHVGSITYLDGSINPYSRGSPESAAFALDSSDWTTLKRVRPKELTPSAIIGLGAGEGITRIRSSLSDPTRRGPWVEVLEEVTGGQKAPMGRLDDVVTQRWSDLAEDEYFYLETDKNYLKPGDWIELRLSPSETATSQIFEIGEDVSSIRRVRLGGQYAAPKYAFLEKRESIAAANLRTGQAFGSQENTAFFGVGTPISLTWTPASSDDRDTEKIELTLWMVEPNESDFSSMAVTLTVKITNTLYPAGKDIAVIRGAPWAKDPVLSQLPIAQWCALDGTAETVQITVTDPTGTLSETPTFGIRVDGIGRYGQTPKKTMTIESKVWSTLTYDYLMQKTWASGTTPNGRSRAWIQVDGTRYYGATISFGNTIITTESEWTKNPKTGANWSQGDLNDLQAGYWCEIPSEGVSGEALLNLTNVAKPTYAIKVVLVNASRAWYTGTHGFGPVLSAGMESLRVELR